MKKLRHSFLPLFLILLIACLPAVIHHFHNHSDFDVHHDCPVFQWESGFVSLYVWVVLFSFELAYSARYYERQKTVFTVMIVDNNHDRAPPFDTPLGYS